MSEKRWTEMTADEQVPPWSLLIDQLLLRQQLDAHNAVAENETALRCKHCGDEIKDFDDGPWQSLGEFGGTGTGAYAERFWCADAPDHEHSPNYGEAEVDDGSLHGNGGAS